jgi:hypothetical protein
VLRAPVVLAAVLRELVRMWEAFVVEVKSVVEVVEVGLEQEDRERR